MPARGSTPAAQARSAITPSHATSTPTVPASSDTTRFSVSACRTRRVRLAPSAVRSENSLLRTVTRASVRFATFAQAISRTNPTEPNSSHSDRSVVGPMTRSMSEIGGDAEAGVGRRILVAQARRDRIHLRARRFNRCRGREPAQHDQPVRATAAFLLPVRPEPERLPELHVRRGQLESRRHHADDFARSRHPLESSVRPSAGRRESLLPKTVADHDGRGSLGKVVGPERSPGEGAVPSSSKKPGPTNPTWTRTESPPPVRVARVNSGRR